MNNKHKNKKKDETPHTSLVKMRSTRMREIRVNEGGFSFVTTMSQNDNSSEFYIYPTRLRNDGATALDKGITIYKYKKSPAAIIEIHRIYALETRFGRVPCKYDLDLVDDPDDVNKKRVKYFNFSDFNNNQDINFDISYLGKDDLYDNYYTYRYFFNDDDQQTRCIDMLEKQLNQSNGQITKTISNSDDIQYKYNITVPLRQYKNINISFSENIITVPLRDSIVRYIPYKPVMINSQQLHHVLTIDQTDNVFRFTYPVDETDSIYYVNIMRPLEIYHDISSTVPSRQWSGYILITIDTNWNISMKVVTGDGWIPNNQWIYGRLWLASGDDKVESNATTGLSNESEYDELFSNPNDNDRGYTGTVLKTHTLKAFRNNNDKQNIVTVEINQNSTTDTKVFKDRKNNDPHYIREGDDIYVLRYQARLEGYYGGKLQTFPSMSIDISGDIKFKLPGKFKIDNGYKFLTMNYLGYQPLSIPLTFDIFYGYDHINKSYYKLDGRDRNNILYLNEKDVVYEKDEQKGIWYVGLKNKIQINHKSIIIYNNPIIDNSVNVILEIDEKWNMNLLLYYEDVITVNEWEYGKLTLETDVLSVSDTISNNLILKKSNITRYTGDGIGIQRGRYYSIRPCGNGAKTCPSGIKINTSKTNQTIKRKINDIEYDTLPVTSLNNFIKIDATTCYVLFEILYEDSGINFVDRIGIQEPYSNITSVYQNKNIDSDQILEINIPTWDYNAPGRNDGDNLMPNAVVNISEALNYDRNEDGSFNVTIIRPIRITYISNITYYPDFAHGGGVIWTVVLTIDIDKNWNVTYKYKTPDQAWFQPDQKNKNIQGEMRIFVNEVNNNNNTEISLKKSKSVSNNNRFDLVDGNYVLNMDNYCFICWSDKRNFDGVSVKYTNSDQKNDKNFRCLDSLMRFDANFASYFFTYKEDTVVNHPQPLYGYLDKSPEYKDRLLENTIILCCKPPTTLYFCYPENKSEPVVDVLYIVLNSSSNVINVSDYVLALSTGNIVYEISDVSDNTTATILNTTLTISKSAGFCTLTAKPEVGAQKSIKLQWSQFYFCYPENKSESITNILNLDNVITKNGVYLVNVSDYVLSTDIDNTNITYKISDVKGAEAILSGDKDDYVAPISFTVSPPQYYFTLGSGTFTIWVYRSNGAPSFWDNVIIDGVITTSGGSGSLPTGPNIVTSKYSQGGGGFFSDYYITGTTSGVGGNDGTWETITQAEYYVSATNLNITSKGAGSCVLTAIRGKSKISINLQWNQLYFCDPKNKLEPVFDVLNLGVVYPPLYQGIVLGRPYTFLRDYVFSIGSDVVYEVVDLDGNKIDSEGDKVMFFNYSPYQLSFRSKEGSCYLTIKQGNLKKSIKLQWDLCSGTNAGEPWCNK